MLEYGEEVHEVFPLHPDSLKLPLLDPYRLFRLLNILHEIVVRVSRAEKLVEDIMVGRDIRHNAARITFHCFEESSLSGPREPLYQLRDIIPADLLLDRKEPARLFHQLGSPSKN